MTAMALSAYPAAAGSRLLGLLWQGFVWTVLRCFSAPMSAALLVAMVGGTFLATSNALYFQHGRHPAPLFAEQALTTTPVDLQKPVQILSPSSSLTTQIAPRPATAVVLEPQTAPIPAMSAAVQEITHAHVMALQEKLKGFGYYEGKADGFYGPQTAAAIREFETANGLEPVGALTPGLFEAVERAMPQKAAVNTAPTITPPAIAQPVVMVKAPVVEAVPVQKIASLDNTGVTVSVNGSSVTAPIGPQGDTLSQIVHRVATAAQEGMSSPSQTSQTALVEKAQRGLASLGFLRSKIDGVAGEGTAKAIRNFEVYYNYDVTGAVSPSLIDLLTQAGAEF